MLTSRLVTAVAAAALTIGSVGAPSAQRGSISECTRYTGAGVTEWSDCLVVVRSSSLTLQIRASYFRSAGASGIDGISDWDISGSGGGCRLDRAKVLSARADDTSGPARARLSCDAGPASGTAEEHPYLDLVVDRSGARTVSNF